MYLEIKAVISGMAIVLLCFVASQIMFISFLYGFLIIIAIGAFVFSDLLLGIKIINTNANLWFDPLPQGTHELCVIKTLSGLFDLLVTTKGAEGIRYGVLHKKKIAVLNEGTGQFHTRNGNLGFIAHENYDRNINLLECKALETLDGDDIKEIRANLLDKTDFKNKPVKKPLLGGIKWHSKTKQ